MAKRMIWALLLIAVVVIVLVLNKGNAEINLLVTKITAAKSIIFLAFTACGVVVGLLLK